MLPVNQGSRVGGVGGGVGVRGGGGVGVCVMCVYVCV